MSDPKTAEAEAPEPVTTDPALKQAANREIARMLDDHGMIPSLRILLDDLLYQRVREMAASMAKDHVFTPAHLRNQPGGCFAVIQQALDWKLSPIFVARSTYTTPGGSVGFEGKLVQAILERSGQFEGGIKYEYSGDWSRVTGKFTTKEGRGGGSFPVPAWTSADAIGLGIIVRGQIRGEAEPRIWPGVGQPFQLTQCFPLNSPLWATDPKTQIAYLAVRRFANQAVPHLLGGMAFDPDDLVDASTRARDITPTDGLSGVVEVDRGAQSADSKVSDLFEVMPPGGGAAVGYSSWERTIQALAIIFDEAESLGLDALRDTWLANHPTIEQLREAGHGEDADALRVRVLAADDRLVKAAGAPAAPPAPAPAPAEIVEPTREPVHQPAPEPQQSAPPPQQQPQVAREPAATTTATPAQVVHVPQPEPAKPRLPGFWGKDSLEIEPPLRNGKADWRAWLAMIQPRLLDAPDDELLSIMLAHSNAHLAAYEGVAGERAYAELQRAIDAARERVKGTMR